MLQGFCGKRIPLCGRNCADSIRRIVSSANWPNSWRCASLIEVRKYWISTNRLRTKTTLSHFRNTGHPGIANQLRIQSQQSCRFFRVAAGSGFPFEQAARPVQLSNGINIGDEIVLARNWPRELDLQVATRLADANAVVLAESVQKLNALLQHAIPCITVRVVQALVLTSRSIRETKRRPHLRAGNKQPAPVQMPARRAWSPVYPFPASRRDSDGGSAVGRSNIG